MKLIPIRNRQGIVAHAIVDDADFEWLNRYRWSFDSDGYARRAIRRDGRVVNFRMHREILGLNKGDERVGDHRNGDRLDNRRLNLRAVTAFENGQRRRGRIVSTSRFRGVHQLKSNGKWQASIRYRDRLIHLGTWDTEDEAAAIAARVRGALIPYSEEASPCAA